MSTTILTKELKEALADHGIETLHAAGRTRLPLSLEMEAPGSLKWLQVENRYQAGMFSYIVSGYACGLVMGRYCSFGEQVQIGRQDHPTNWMSTSPFQYLNGELFSCGNDFSGAADYHSFRSHTIGRIPATRLKVTNIGNDVWVGHGAMIRAGITIGDGAIIASGSLVVKDVPPYAVVAGNPAQVKKYRFPSDVIETLLELKWWNYAPWQMANIDYNDINAILKQLEVVVANENPFTPSLVKLKDLVDAL